MELDNPISQPSFLRCDPLPLLPTPPPTVPAKPLSEAIGDDHARPDYCSDQLTPAASLPRRIEWRNQLVWTLARHAISEELIS
ncbi:hypothetical protein MMC17_003566 [Xylographa soralifera]|nr:hypothetical protein [Xylographa soralifera]